MTPAPAPSTTQRWIDRAQPLVRAFHRYANWLVSISWKRFILLSILLVVLAAILKSLPPFSWRITETINPEESVPHVPPPPPKPPKAPKVRIEQPREGASAPADSGMTITIDENGVRIGPKLPAAAASAASGASSAADDDAVVIRLPADVDKEAVRDAIEEARTAIRDAAEAQREAAVAAKEAASAAEEAQAELRGPRGLVHRTRTIEWGDFLTDLAMLWVIASAIIKATYKGRLQAEVKAAQATETAEAESLKRQVVEARMAAMQAQVEPHFLFNTLASIDHLIETDPARASQMQKNLIALLRASMPTMRETAASGVRDLGREVAVIRPYLEILKVRMEERLATQIDIPDGLLSAEFPPMMLQSLVENAIKHGLEPKPEGGTLSVKAEIVHGKLAVRVADTGLGFGKAATAGTGVGLANIRERLQLLYGGKAALTITEPATGGTVVTITVPYKTIEGVQA